MKIPLDSGEWVRVDEVASTQKLAAALLKEGRDVAVVMAHHQNAGTGRFGREWFSQPGDSLTASFVFREYANYPTAHLVGMAFAVGAAGALRCQIRWPNDLVIGDKKVAGVLTELLPDEQGRLVPVVGLGVNLNQTEFPEVIAHRATSLHIAHGGTYEPEAVARKVLESISHLPEPASWSALSPIWMLFDRTPGKRYLLPTGEEAIALGIGSDAQLLCSVDGESRSVMAGEALFGPAFANRS